MKIFRDMPIWVKYSLVFLLAVFIVLNIPWILIILGVWSSPNPPKPDITYAEFPFSLVYELNGEQIIVNDTYVCEYEGVDHNEGMGKFREWNGYIKGTNEKVVKIFENDKLHIWCNVGIAENYMNDSLYGYIDEIKPTIIHYDKEKGESLTSSEIQDVYKENGINFRLIECQLSEPLDSCFTEKKIRKTGDGSRKTGDGSVS